MKEKLASMEQMVNQMQQQIAQAQERPFQQTRCTTDTPTITTQPNVSSCIVKADTGATRHYQKEEDKTTISSLTTLSNGPSAALPDGSSITASSK
eukprot:8543527-Ditylum_brightwellii.AAC.1